MQESTVISRMHLTISITLAIFKLILIAFPVVVKYSSISMHSLVHKYIAISVTIITLMIISEA